MAFQGDNVQYRPSNIFPGVAFWCWHPCMQPPAFLGVVATFQGAFSCLEVLASYLKDACTTILDPPRLP